MSVDVEPEMGTAAAVAWEAAPKVSLLVLAVSLLDRGCCTSVYCSSTGYGISTCCCCSCCCCCGRCSSTRRWWSTGSHRTESLLEHNCVSSGYWSCVSHGPSADVPRNPDRKKTTKPNNNLKTSRQRMHMTLLVRDNTWPGPSHGGKAYETRALYGPARAFDGPTHRPTHALSRTKRCMCIP